MRVNRLSLQKQLLIYMILLIARPLLLMTAFGNYYYANGIDELSSQFSTQMLDQVRMNIEASVGTVDRIIEYLSMDDDVINYLRLENFYSPGRIALETAVRDRMRIYSDAIPSLWAGCWWLEKTNYMLPMNCSALLVIRLGRMRGTSKRRRPTANGF